MVFLPLFFVFFFGLSSVGLRWLFLPSIFAVWFRCFAFVGLVAFLLFRLIWPFLALPRRFLAFAVCFPVRLRCRAPAWLLWPSSSFGPDCSDLGRFAVLDFLGQC